MSDSMHIDQEDLTMFALQLLSEDETAHVEAHVQGCSECTAELRQIRADLALYAATVEPVAMPEGARGRFLAKLDAEAVPASAPRPIGPAATVPAPRPAVAPQPSESRKSGSGKLLPWVSVVGWAAAAASLLVAVGLRHDRDALRSELATQTQQTARLEANVEKARQILGTLSDPSAVRVNLTVPKAAPVPSAKATYEQKSGTLLLIASNLAPLQAEKVYELWLIPANGSAPVPAGTFSPDAHGNASLLVPALHGAVTAKAFGITVEKAGGSVTPTMPILLAGAPA